MRALVAVFAKPPRVGQVKTRLAAELKEAFRHEPKKSMEAFVCALAQAFVDDTWELLSGFADLRRVLASTGPMHLAGAYDDRRHRWSQGEGDLGQRLRRVLRRGLEDHALAIALGADSPGLPAPHLMAAVGALETGADAVLGPCDDGGFYLLGLRRCPAGLLDGIPWSQPDTCAQTRQNLEAAGLRVATLPTYFDVDHFADLRRLAALLAEGRVKAPATCALLESQPWKAWLAR